MGRKESGAVACSGLERSRLKRSGLETWGLNDRAAGVTTASHGATSAPWAGQPVALPPPAICRSGRRAPLTGRG